MPPVSQHRLYRIVQSRQNRRVKELRASFSPVSRSETGQVGIEGEHLLAEALRSGIRIVTIFFRSGAEPVFDRLALPDHVEIIELPADIFLSAVTTESPQGIAALVEPKTFSLEDTLRARSPLIVIAAALQDPGNLGTLIRSAEAFGASGVITLPGTVSPWNPKALRASSGSVFRLPVVAGAIDEVFFALQTAQVRVLAAVADTFLDASKIDLAGPIAMLIGNEGSGISADLLAKTDGKISIPCPGPVESLNAGVAASILLYEASRQRALQKTK